MIAPRLVLEVGYGATWQTEPGDIVWVDETARVSDRRQVVEIVRGASSARGVVDTGELQLTLNNQDRRFDPLYTAGPLYGLLVPGVPIRVLAQVAGGLLPIYDDEDPIYEDDAPVVAEWETAVPVWSGTVASWPQRYDRGNTWATVPLQCFDRFDKLSRAKIPRSVLESEILLDHPVAYWRLDETSGRTAYDRTGNRNHGTYTDGTTALATTMKVEDEPRMSGIGFDGEHFMHSGDASSVVVDSDHYTIELVVDLTDAEGDGSFAHTVFQQGDGNDGHSINIGYSVIGPVPILFPPSVIAVNWFFSDSSVAPAPSQGWSTTTIRRGLTHVLVGRDGPSSTDLFVHVRTVDSAGNRVSPSAPSIGPVNGTWVARNQGDAAYGGVMLDAVSPIGSVAIYDYALPTLRRSAHGAAFVEWLGEQRTDERIDWILDEIGWPAGLRDFERGRTILGPATFEPGDKALAYLRLLEATEDGRLFIAADGSLVFRDRYWPWLAPEATISQVTFTDLPGGACYADFQLDIDDDLIVNVARFTRRGGAEQVATDPASIAVHGEAEEQRSDLLVATDAQTRSLAEWTVATRSVPQPRVPSIRVALHTYNGDDQAALLALDLGHRITVERTPQGVGDPISLDFIVEGVRHEVAFGQWWLDLYVSPAPQATATLFTLSESELSGPDILAH